MTGAEWVCLVIYLGVNLWLCAQYAKYCHQIITKPKFLNLVFLLFFGLPFAVIAINTK